jgi:2-polyprenyl-6-hydroxyphenyl methylase/3-demethylubiquinone-9 3-methyltransferase
MTDLTKLSSHFAFGENWASYAARITEDEINQAERDLCRLLATDSLAGRDFLDIGSGSGVHSLAALRLGAKRVVACDIDPTSVRTTDAVLRTFSPSNSYEVIERSVFELDPESLGRFDVVYSWGVLHHTGDLTKALQIAASLVARGGEFAFALYRKTLFCPLWKLEKKWYSMASPQKQAFVQKLYRSAFALGLRLTARDLATYVATYRSKRGMDFHHDVHDWLGGYPYESMSPADVDQAMQAHQLQQVRSITGMRAIDRVGMLGSGCDEYVYRRQGSRTGGVTGSSPTNPASC